METVARGRIRKFFFSIWMAAAAATPLLGLGLILPGATANPLPTPAVLATPARITLPLNRRAGESYRGFLQRAEAFAGAGIQQTFTRDILVSEVIVTVVSNNLGVSVPLMDVQVTRSQWQATPVPSAWARYYDGSPTALELLER